MAYLWGDPLGAEPSARFVKLPPGSAGVVDTESALFRAVVILGQVTHPSEETPLEAGSYFDADGAVPLSCAGDVACVLYVRGVGVEVR